MDNMLIRNRLNMPVITGTPTIERGTPAQQEQTGQQMPSFRQVLEAQVVRQEDGLSFSKHAASRLLEREIDLSDGGMERLNEGVRIAREKGLDDTLIIMGNSAFIVSARNGTVITAMGGSDLRGKAITNIEGTVII